MKTLQIVYSKIGLLTLIVTIAFAANYLFAAWQSPPADPPSSNVDAPVNVGTTDQVKDAGLSVNALSVFGDNLTHDGNIEFKFENTADSSAKNAHWRLVANDGTGNFHAYLNSEGGTSPVTETEGYAFHEEWYPGSGDYTFETSGTSLAEGASISWQQIARFDGDRYAWFKEVRGDNYCDGAGSNCFSAADVGGSSEDLSTDNFLHVQDRKSSGTHGGSCSTDIAWQTRDLNTVAHNTISGASLSSNRISLPAGTYYIEASAPGYQIDRHVAKLRNVTDSTNVIIGTASRSDASDPSVTRSEIAGTFTIGGTKTFEIQHECERSISTNGFGLGHDFGVQNVYTDVRIWKVN